MEVYGGLNLTGPLPLPFSLTNARCNVMLREIGVTVTKIKGAEKELRTLVRAAEASAPAGHWRVQPALRGDSRSGNTIKHYRVG